MVTRLGVAFPADDLPGAVELWRAVLGAEPTFVDGDRWAQFDVAGTRIALAGTDRVADTPVAMLKVDDVEAEHGRLTAIGVDVDDVITGEHERRFVVRAGDGVVTAVVYGSL